MVLQPVRPCQGYGSSQPTLQATHWLDRELNETLRQYENNQLAERVRPSYDPRCGR